MSEKTTTLFEELVKVDVSKHTYQLDTKKAGFTYLSWPWAIDYITKKCQDFAYEVKLFEDKEGRKLPYVYDIATGYMVFTSVRIDGVTKEMWLPVLDHNNHAMLNHVYQIKTKNSEFTVAPATMSDINRAIMRCLVKNIAMFGLGLYIYQKENRPIDDTGDDDDSNDPKSKDTNEKYSPEEIQERLDMIDFLTQIDPKAVEKLMTVKKVSSVDDLETSYIRKVYNAKQGAKA